MSTTDARTTELEIRLTEQMHMLDEISDMVAKQGDTIEKLTRQVRLLMENAADAQPTGGAVIADQKPPHW